MLGCIAGFHMTSPKVKLQNYWSSWDFTFMMYKRSWKLVFMQIFRMGPWFCDKISKLFLREATLTWRPRESYFGEFGYLNSSCVRKSIVLMFLSSSRDKFTLSFSKTQFFWCFCWFPAAMLEPNRTGFSMAAQLISKNLAKTFLHISCERKNCCD